MTSNFPGASDRVDVFSVCLLEQKGLVGRLGEEVSRAASDLLHDPRAFLRDLVSPANTKDSKRRRLIYGGLAAALVLHAVFLAVVVVAGWHRILEAPKSEERPEITWLKPRDQIQRQLGGDKDESRKGDPSSAGGGQEDPNPATSGSPPPMAQVPPLVQPNPSNIPDPTLPMQSTIPGPVNEPPPPPGETFGDPKGRPGEFSAGPGKGGGIGVGEGTSVGSGSDPIGTPGRRTGPGGDNGTGINRTGTDVGGIRFNDPKPVGFVQFRWVYRPTPVVTPEAQLNKVSGTVLLIATFGADGTISDIEIRNPVNFMTESAVEALKRSKFRPASIHGVPITLFRVPIRIDVRVSDES
jgi:TonB family protein